MIAEALVCYGIVGGLVTCEPPKRVDVVGIELPADAVLGSGTVPNMRGFYIDQQSRETCFDGE